MAEFQKFEFGSKTSNILIYYIEFKKCQDCVFDESASFIILGVPFINRMVKLEWLFFVRRTSCSHISFIDSH